jgi:hypothetical protein
MSDLLSVRRGWRCALGRKQGYVGFIPVLAAVGLIALTQPGHAEFQVRSPIVEEGEWEVEHNGALLFNRHDRKVDETSFTNSIGYGVTSWLKLEFEGEWEGARGEGGARYVGSTIESTFQLTPQGKYFADFGLFAEFSKARFRGEPDTFEFGPIMQMDVQPFRLTFNALFERAIFGPNRTNALGFGGAAQVLLPLNDFFLSPGLEYYAEIEDLRHRGRFNDQLHLLGPVVVGGFKLAQQAKVKYEAGYLFPLSRGADGGALRWKLELELRF